MAWQAWATRLEELRDRLANDPAGVRTEVERDLLYRPDVVGSPSARVRFYGLLVAALRNLGDLDGALEVLKLGSSLASSPSARADLLVHGASLHIERRDAARSAGCVGEALDLIEGELSRPEPKCPYSRRQRRGLVSLKAACLVLRGERRIRLEDEAYLAVQDSLEALALARHRTAIRVRMAAITVLSGALMHSGTSADVVRALTLLSEADRALKRRKVRRDHVHRVIIRWCRALAWARLGSVERAQAMMEEVVDRLIEAGQIERARHAIDTLVWIVGERAAKPGLANYMRDAYRSRIEDAVRVAEA